MFGKTGYRAGGTRGGRSEFNWTEHRGDSNYLGASLHAPIVGRRDRDRDWFWWQKKQDTLGKGVKENAEYTKALQRLEVLKRQQVDAELLADALGETAVSKRFRIETEIKELQAMLGRGYTKREDAERIKGLGAAPVQRHLAHKEREDEQRKRENEINQINEATRLQAITSVPSENSVFKSDFEDTEHQRGEEISSLKRSRENDNLHPTELNHEETAAELKRRRKQEKKEKKKARKIERKHHKKSFKKR